VLSSKQKWEKGPFDKYFALSKIRFKNRISNLRQNFYLKKVLGTSKKIIYPLKKAIY
jgi:hypothetical protein